ncbi:molybdate ABC transporter substrate-binding protein [Dermacoccaceae bacterium W4C1]
MNIRSTRPLALAAALAMTLPLAACGSNDSDSAGASGASGSGSSSASVTGTITVFAAASLKESFTTLGKEFEAKHPGTTVKFSFGPSSGLATQLNQGAPADVFASASTKNMDQAVTAKSVNTPADFAKNKMTIVTPPKNPGKVTGLNSLTSSSVKVALCEEAVPCGTVAAKIFSAQKLTVKPVTREVDVKAVLTKVRLGEVDAGMVYVTDAKAAGSDVHSVTIPDDENASTSYPIATTTSTKNAATATAFMEFVRSADGEKALAAAGFAAP